MAARLALFAVVLQLLAGFTGAAHAMQRLAAGNLIAAEICSTTASTLPGSPQDTAPGSHAASSHCPFCVSASSPPPVPVALAVAVAPAPLAALPTGQDATSSVAAAPLFAHAPPRAPPHIA